MYILGIETSCDETACALYHPTLGLVADAIYTQTLHAEYGGVVPELASRDHISKLTPMVQELLAAAKITYADLSAIAYTNGPGLIGALMVGASFGFSLAYSLGIPAYGVHHMEGHLLSPMLADKKPTFPFLSLLVSGGHTLISDVAAYGKYHLLGQSVDDAAGEAFDKVAKILGLGFPGGPQLAMMAAKGEAIYTMPQPMLHQGLDMSFSGLKTHVATFVKKNPPQNQQDIANIAASFEKTVVELLLAKLKKAQQQTGHTQIVVAGGVSANARLRATLEKWAAEENLSLFLPPLRYCTDNAAMIALAAFMAIEHGVAPSSRLEVTPRSSLF